MRCCSTKNGICSVQVSVDFLETPQKAWHCAGADGDMGADLHVSSTQFARDNFYTFFRLRIFHPQQVLRQKFAETAMDFTDAVTGDRAPSQAAAVNPFL